MKYEFTIFGSGISAKIISSLLARSGFRVCLIKDKDKNKVDKNTNLVTFLSSGSLNYLSMMLPTMQLFSKSPEIKIIKCQLNSLSNKKSQSIEFNCSEEEYLGKIVKNSSLEDFLDKEIDQLSNIHIISTSRLDIIENNLNTVKLKLSNGEYIETDIFVLSSNKRNIIEQIDINFIKNDLEQEALSICLKGEIKNNSYAFQKFTSEGPLALLPYSKNEASVVWSLKNDSKILLKDKEELTQIISNHLNEYITSVTIKSIEKHKLQFVYAKNLYYNNTVLIGNIAHNIHPIAGQGLNLSIKDIALLLKQMSRYKSLGYKINDRMILEEFEMKRKLDNSAYSFGTFSLNGILSSNNKFVNNITRKGLGLVEKSNYLKKLFVKSATGKNFFGNF